MLFRPIYCLLFLLLLPLATRAQQDTLFVTPREADSLFMAKNLSLLAARYDVDIQKVWVKQARIWDNPSFSAELNLYNPSIRRWFDVGATGQKIFSIDQVIKIAGQRNSAAKWAQEGVKISELDFLDLIRTLKFSLRQSLYSLYYNRQTIETYSQQLNLLDTIIKAYDVQLEKGNIPLKESLRLKALYYELNNDKTTLYNSVLEEENSLRILLGTTGTVLPVIDDAELARYRSNSITRDGLVAQALEQRPDLKRTEAEYRQSLVNLQWQKRSGVPDLHVGAVYDQAGSYVNRYSGVTLGIDLPVFDRNQSNIKIAKFQVMQAEYAKANDSLRVVSEVTAAWDRLLRAEKEYQKIDTDYVQQFAIINSGITENFTKRNISMLEFADLFEAYNQTIMQLNTMQINRIMAYEELNYLVGTELFGKP